MSMITKVFKTSDGKSFTDWQEAERYETYLWDRFCTYASVNVSDVVQTLDDSEEREYYGTQKDIFKELFKDYCQEAGILPTVMGEAV